MPKFTLAPLAIALAFVGVCFEQCSAAQVAYFDSRTISDDTDTLDFAVALLPDGSSPSFYGVASIDSTKSVVVTGAQPIVGTSVVQEVQFDIRRSGDDTDIDILNLTNSFSANSGKTIVTGSVISQTAQSFEARVLVTDAAGLLSPVLLDYNGTLAPGLSFSSLSSGASLQSLDSGVSFSFDVDPPNPLVYDRSASYFSSFTVSAQAVPEPSAIVLAGGAIAGLVATGRIRHRARRTASG